MSAIATAQVIHGLTGLASEDIPVERCWPLIAQVLLRQGFSWSALNDLAAMESRDDSVIETKLGKLHDNRLPVRSRPFLVPSIAKPGQALSCLGSWLGAGELLPSPAHHRI